MAPLIRFRATRTSTRRVREMSLVADRDHDRPVAVDRDARLDVAAAVQQRVVEQDLDALGQRARGDIGLDDLWSYERQGPADAMELGSDCLDVATNECRHVGAFLRCNAPSARQREELVDAFIKPANLGEGFSGFAPCHWVAAVGDQLQADGDRREWRTQLMAGVGTELAFGGHQRGKALATVFQGLGDRVDLDQPAAGGHHARIARPDLNRCAGKAIEWTAELASLEQRSRGSECRNDCTKRDDHVPRMAHTVIDRRTISRHRRREIAGALHLDRHHMLGQHGAGSGDDRTGRVLQHDLGAGRRQPFDVCRCHLTLLEQAVGQRDGHRLGLPGEAQARIGAHLVGEQDATGDAGDDEDRKDQGESRTDHATAQPRGHRPRFARRAQEG